MSLTLFTNSRQMAYKVVWSPSALEDIEAIAATGPIYRIQKEVVTIVTVIHGKRLLVFEEPER